MTRSGGLTRQLDLRTGRTVWGAYRAPRVPAAPLRRDARTDVLVVGMGISGAMVAEALTAAGHAVMLIDRRGPMLGSTARDDRAGAVRDRHAADACWRGRSARDARRARVAALAARGRQPAGADRRARRSRAARAPRASLYLAGDLLDAAGLRGRGGGAAGGRALCRLPRRSRASASGLRPRPRRRDRQPRQPRARSAQADGGAAAGRAAARGAAACAGRGDGLRPLGRRASRSRPPAGR